MPEPGFFGRARDRLRSTARNAVNALPEGARQTLRDVRTAARETGTAIADVARAANTEEGRQAIRSSVDFARSARGTVQQAARFGSTVAAVTGAGAATGGVAAVVGAARVGYEGYRLGSSAVDTYNAGRTAYNDISAAAQTAEGQRAGTSVGRAGSAWRNVFG